MVACLLPGSAWMGLFLSHFTWAIDEIEDLAPEERLNVARQLQVLYEAAREGASAANDDLVTEQREMLTVILDKLGYQPTDADHALLAGSVFRHEDLRSLIHKLVAAATT